MSKIEKKISAIYSILWRVGLIFIILFVVIAGYRSIKEEKYVMEAFNVPQRFANDGFTGAELSQNVLTEVENLREIAKSAKESHGVGFSGGNAGMEVEVMGVGVSVNLVINIAKQSLGMEYKNIVGSVITEGDVMKLILRITGEKPKTFETYFTDTSEYNAMKTIIEQAALEVLKITDPVVLAYYYYRTKDYASCVEIVRFIIENYPEDKKWAYNIWGNVTQYTNKDMAMEMYKKALKEDSEFAIAYANWADILSLHENYEAALDKMRLAVKYDDLQSYKDEHIYTLQRWGKKLYKEGDSASALQKFESSTGIDPQNPLAWYKWGEYLMKKSLFEEADEKFMKGIELDPQNLDTWLKWANDLMRYKKDSATAREKYTEALKLNINNAKVYNNWARRLAYDWWVDSYEDWEGAIDKYLKIIEIDKDFAKSNQIYDDVAELYIEIKDYRAAIRYARIQLRDDKSYWSSYLLLAKAYSYLNEDDLFWENFNLALLYGGYIWDRRFTDEPYNRYDQNKLKLLVKKYAPGIYVNGKEIDIEKGISANACGLLEIKLKNVEYLAEDKLAPIGFELYLVRGRRPLLTINVNNYLDLKDYDINELLAISKPGDRIVFETKNVKDWIIWNLHITE